MEARGFVAALPTLAGAPKSQREIKSLLEKAYGEKKLSYSQLNSPFKAVKDKKKNN
jgi:hypothetical protein